MLFSINSTHFQYFPLFRSSFIFLVAFFLFLSVYWVFLFFFYGSIIGWIVIRTLLLDSSRRWVVSFHAVDDGGRLNVRVFLFLMLSFSLYLAGLFRNVFVYSQSVFILGIPRLSCKTLMDQCSPFSRVIMRSKRGQHIQLSSASADVFMALGFASPWCPCELSDQVVFRLNFPEWCLNDA